MHLPKLYTVSIPISKLPTGEKRIQRTPDTQFSAGSPRWLPSDWRKLRVGLCVRNLRVSLTDYSRMGAPACTWYTGKLVSGGEGGSWVCFFIPCPVEFFVGLLSIELLPGCRTNRVLPGCHERSLEQYDVSCPKDRAKLHVYYSAKVDYYYLKAIDHKTILCKTYVT